MIAPINGSLILDWTGQPYPLSVSPRFVAKTDRKPLAKAEPIRASYDAARDGTWLENHWGNADSLSADDANSATVRRKLRERSRYEAANNSYYAGSLRTYCNDLVGTGPRLRMQTLSTGFNRMVEREFHAWANAVQLRRKLWCLAHAKVQDGEGLAVLRDNPGVPHRVKLDVVLYESEQFSTPYLTSEPGHIDGIDFDEYGNPQTYHRLLEHPGSSSVSMIQEVEDIPAQFVLHWFRMERPGQHRGVPECASGLNLGAAHRQVREANVMASKTAASFGAILETPLPASSSDDVPDVASSFTEMTIPNGVIVAAPFGNTVKQLDPKHPGPQYESFQNLCVAEMLRPLSMPRNKATGDSGGMNFASGRLDCLVYYGEQDVDREDCNSVVLNKLFALWFAFAVREFGWLGGNPDTLSEAAMSHGWDWPARTVLDQKAQAFADEKNLADGATTHTLLYSERGYDLRDEINTEVETMVDVFGVDEATARARLFDKFYPSKQAAPDPAKETADRVDELEDASA